MLENIKNIFNIDKIGEPPWGGFSQVARGAEQFREHPSTIKQRSCRNVQKMTSEIWSFFESEVQNFCGRIIQDNIGEPPWEYSFLINLLEKEYPKYLAKIFKYRTGEKLPLKYDFKQQAWVIDKKRCKTFNQKIQWLKLYDATQLKKDCTDKVAVRDYVAEKIGKEYLKPILQICDCFDEIDFDNLPNAFVIKCNHGSKWQYIIKDKDEFLNTPQLFETVKRNITGWLEQEYWCWGGFEMQYKGIKPKILIEKLLKEDINKNSENIQVYCFNGEPKIIFKFYGDNTETVYDEYFNEIEKIFISSEKIRKREADYIIKKSFELSKILSKNFSFVRIDWMLYKNQLYFEEMTFTPYSGFHKLNNNKKVSKFIDLEGDRHGF